MVNNRLNLNQRAGAYADFNQVKTCNLEPNVDQYKAPCGSLSDNQFGFKDVVGYYSGGRNSRQGKKHSLRGSIRERRHKCQNGGCGSAKADCMGNTIADMGDMTHLSTASEQAWFHRNTYGAPSSTNVISQKGGKDKKSNQTSRKQQRRQRSRNNIQ